VIEVSRDDAVLTIRIAGEIDLANADGLEAVLEDAVDSSVADTRIDLGAVEYLDSAGVRVLFVLADRLRTRQIGLQVVAPPGSPARRVLEVAGFPRELWT
jgi:anti-anti-sigma factor